MEPRIQYAKTSDGVSIAHCSIGEGPVLVATSPAVFSNVSLEMRTPAFSSWYEGLASNRRLVRFDWRGQGMSQRDVHDYSLEALDSDLGTVIDSLQKDQVDLLGIFAPGASTVSYAARHPERVRRLILWGVPTNNRDMAGETFRAINSLADRDWDLFSETLAHSLVGWSRGAMLGHQWAAFIRASINKADYLALMDAVKDQDIAALLGDVKAPTLIIQQDNLPITQEHTRTLAAGISGAQIIQLDDADAAPYLSEQSTLAILQFLGEWPVTRAPKTGTPSGTAIILFADIAGSTALTERLGDTAFRDKARGLDEAMRTAIRDNDGTPIEGKLLGDGVLAVFASAAQAIEAALACGRAGGECGLPLHLGLHAGDVIREENNVYGGRR